MRLRPVYPVLRREACIHFESGKTQWDPTLGELVDSRIELRPVYLHRFCRGVWHMIRSGLKGINCASPTDGGSHSVIYTLSLRQQNLSRDL
jgi:hypothetical protein